MARLLFNVCGNAQGAAAAAAIAAAQGLALPESAGLEGSIASEAMQEHLWRLLLDWPKALGLSQVQTDFVRWHGLLRSVSVGKGDMDVLRAEIEDRWLGCSAEDWKTRSLDELQSWWQVSESPAAQLLAALDEMDVPAGSESVVALLPNWTAAQVVEACGDCLDADFAAQPRLEECTAETGVLGYHAQTPLLQAMMRERPNRLMARVLARVLDVLHIAAEGYHERLGSLQVSNGVGLAKVRTARGMLLHHVRLGAGKVEDYLIVAPTEWNFHQQGAIAAGLQGMAVSSRDRLVKLVGLHVLSLDPCVEFEIEISDA